MACCQEALRHSAPAQRDDGHRSRDQCPHRDPPCSLPPRRGHYRDLVVDEDPWYSERRERWRPDRVRLLLLAESAPHPGDGPRRYLYDEDLTASDGLFREVAKALVGAGKLTQGRKEKLPWLRRLKDQGTFLIDLAPIPVNRNPVNRDEVLASHVANCVARAQEINPEGIIVIKQNVFTLLHRPLRDANLPLLHNTFIPFPGSGQQKRFQSGLAAALRTLT